MDELGEPMDVEMVPATDDSKVVDSGETDVKPFNTNNVQAPEVTEYYRTLIFAIRLASVLYFLVATMIEKLRNVAS